MNIEKKQRSVYLPPKTEAIIMMTQTIIAASVNDWNSGDIPDDFTDLYLGAGLDNIVIL